MIDCLGIYILTIIMSNFLIILGLILFFFCFFGFMATLVIYLPKAEKDGEKWAIWPFAIFLGMLVTGIASYHFGMSMKKDKPMECSKACAVVLGYKHYKNCSGRDQTRCNPYEKIILKIDGSAYSRDMRFDASLARKQVNERVCFSFYDRYKYSHLKNSQIVEWLAP